MAGLEDGNREVLAGVRIVDLTEGLAGPAATWWLAELGADVIKVEPPGGDAARRTHPVGFATWNRSKRSIRLDPEDASDRRSLDDLLARADAVVHGFTPHRATELGLDVDAVTARHPALIVATVTPFPVGHPDQDRQGDELLVQARLGIMDEQEALRPGPMFIRLPVASWGAAYLLAGGLVNRLIGRERTGHCEPIHTSLMQGALAPAALYWQRAGDPPTWLEEHTLPKMNMPPHIGMFRCSDDRWLQVMGAFTKCDVLRPELDAVGAAHLFAERLTVDNRHGWDAVFERRTVDEWTALLWPEGVICMPVLEVGEVFATEQARCNGYALDVDHPVFGATVQASIPFQVDGPAAVRRPSPVSPDVYSSTVWADVSLPDLEGPELDPGSPPLAGIRVVDFGSFVAGPFGSQCLADFGAEVIKVEPIGGEKGREINQFTGCQRGKRSIEIDLRHPKSREVVERLIASADVVMHNMRPAASRRMGIDEATVRAINPDVVFAHSTGYGDCGPWADLAAFDPTGFALSGWAHGISGPGRRPSWLRMSAMDCTTGLANFVGISAALLARCRFGGPHTVKTSLLAVAATFSSETMLMGRDLAPAEIATVNDNQTGADPWERIYEASDGWIAVSANTPDQRAAMGRVLGGEHSGFVPVVRERLVSELIDQLEAAGVPVERVALDHRNVLFDAELTSGSGLVRRVEGTPYGWFENPGGFWSGRHGVVRNDRPIPAAGAHTAEVLDELGLASEQIESLCRDGVVHATGQEDDG